MAKVTKNWREKFSIKSLLKNKQQTTFCYCPVCKSELISTNSFVGDSKFVRYRCNKCKTDSKWIFATPVPFCVESDMDELRIIMEQIDVEVGSTINSANSNPKVIRNMININKELKRMKEILDKY